MRNPWELIQDKILNIGRTPSGRVFQPSLPLIAAKKTAFFLPQLKGLHPLTQKKIKNIFNKNCLQNI